MADEMSLQPLQISGMMPPPQAMVAPAAPPPDQGQNAEDGVAMLQAMFPDTDKGVLEVILMDNSGNVEASIEMLLEMTGGGGGAPLDEAAFLAEAGLAPSVDQDEELAKSLFLQFATELEKELKLKVPDEVRQDPDLYQAFVASALAEHEQRQRGGGASSSLAASGGSGSGGLDSLAERVFKNNNASPAVRNSTSGSGGMSAFLDRFRGKAKTSPLMSSTRVKVIAVDDKRESLLSNAHEPSDKI